ncbi:MAG: hypothetical protein AAFQ43_05730 [Bacteroidota bacterium]
MHNTLPCPSDYCAGCNRIRCQCPPPGYEEHVRDEAYERGYSACLADGYSEHPLYWMSVSSEAEAALARVWRHLCTGGRIIDTNGRRVYGSHVFGARPRPWPWPFRSNPLTSEPDPESFLEGWDDAGAGMPSAIQDPDAHAVHAKALDDYEPWALHRQPDISDIPFGPWPAPSEDVLVDEYDLPF